MNTEPFYRKIPGFRSGKPWKMALAGFVYGLFLLIIVIAIIDPSTETANEDDPIGPEPIEGAVAPIDDNANEEDNADEEVVVDEKINIQTVLSILKENFKDTAEIKFDSDNRVYHIIPTDPGFISDLMLAINRNDIAIEAWNDLVASTKTLSGNISNILPDCMVSITNPTNKDNSLLIVSDGFVLYNFIND